MNEALRTTDIGRVGALLSVHDAPKWRCEWLIEKRWKAPDSEHDAGDIEYIHGKGNLLLNGGADVIWNRIITRNPSTAVNNVNSAFANANAKIGVGASSVAAAASQTGLQTTGTKTFSSMQATYPTHTTGTSTGARSASFRAVFTTAQANYAWKEWVIVNSTGQRALNRKVQSLGTKTSAAQWTFTATLTLS